MLGKMACQHEQHPQVNILGLREEVNPSRVTDATP